MLRLGLDVGAFAEHRGEMLVAPEAKVETMEVYGRVSQEETVLISWSVSFEPPPDTRQMSDRRITSPNTPKMSDMRITSHI